MKKKIIIVMLIIISILPLVLVGCSTTHESNNEPHNNASKETLALDGTPTYELNELAGYYTLYIRGTVKNNSNNSYSYAYIQFSITDDAGNVLGTAIDNVGFIDSYGSWSFEAMYYGSAAKGVPKHYRLVELQGIK